MATKRDRMTQAEAQPVVDLQPEQWTCIARLLAGATDEEAGTAAGVSRSTVQRWKGDAAFVAALNAERVTVWAAHTDKLRSLLGKALDVLMTALDSDDEKLRMQAAVKVLSSAGDLWGAVCPSGPVTAQAVQAKQRRDRLLDLI